MRENACHGESRAAIGSARSRPRDSPMQPKARRPPPRRWNSSLGSTNVDDNIATEKATEATNESDDPSSATTKAAISRNKKKLLKQGRDKRRKFIGIAKAVDRGQFQNTYSPGGTDGTGFVAKSGLPDLTKSFCVLGIESSCDDTGGEYMIVFQMVIMLLCISLGRYHPRRISSIPGRHPRRMGRHRTWTCHGCTPGKHRQSRTISVG